MAEMIRALRGPLTSSPVESMLRLIPAAAYMTAIFFVSSIPGEKITVHFDDRIAHFIEYFILGVLLVFAGAGFRGGTGRVAEFMILAFVAVFAIADEYHQSLVPQRFASVKDWGFDMLGAFTAVFILRRLNVKKERVR